VLQCEQLAICIHWVDQNFSIHKDCIGLVQLDATDVEYIASVSKQILLRCSLLLSNCRA